MNSKDVVLYGGSNCRELLSNMVGSEKQVRCIASAYSEETSVCGIPVCRPQILNDPEYSDCLVVVTLNRNRYYEIAGFLIKEYGVDPGRIIRTEEWISQLLEDPSIRIEPHSVRLESCTICQLDCADCYMRKYDYGTMGKGYLTHEKYAHFLDSNPHVERVEFCNSGEALLNPELIDILQSSSERSVSVTFESGNNFNTVSETLLEALVKYGTHSMLISIDGVTQETYEKYRRKGNLDRVLSNIKRLNDYKKKYQTTYPRLIWQFILMNHNQHEVARAKQMASELGMDIRYKLDWSWDRYFLPENPEELSEITGFKEFNLRDYQRHHSDGFLHYEICQGMYAAPQINYDGRLLGCCTVYLDDWNVNVFETGLEQAVNMDSYRNAIRYIYTGKGSILQTPCEKCFWNKRKTEIGM